MEKESNISLGGAINLHTLVVLTMQTIIIPNTLFANLCVRDKGKNTEVLKMFVGGKGMYLIGGGKG